MTNSYRRLGADRHADNLIRLLDRQVDLGRTAIVIEHNLDVARRTG